MIIPNLIETLLADTLPGGTKIAKNAFQAAHIANGLKLTECDSLDEARARWRRYRGWRVAGENVQAAYRRAIDGEEPSAPMFSEAAE